MFPKSLARGLSVFALLLMPTISIAQEIDGADTAWIMTSTALVLFMTIPGLSLFYGGLVRVRNVLSVLMQCFSITCVASLVWLILGYSLAFSEGNGFIGGFSNILFANVQEETAFRHYSGITFRALSNDFCRYNASIDFWWFCRAC